MSPISSRADTNATQAVFDLLAMFAQNSALKRVFGPGSSSHPDLRPNVLADVREYVTGPSSDERIYFKTLVTNHWGGTAALSDGPGGVDPATLILRGTNNLAVVDASLLPINVAARWI